jgi:hypothetical protein
MTAISTTFVIVSVLFFYDFFASYSERREGLGINLFLKDCIWHHMIQNPCFCFPLLQFCIDSGWYWSLQLNNGIPRTLFNIRHKSLASLCVRTDERTDRSVLTGVRYDAKITKEQGYAELFLSTAGALYGKRMWHSRLRQKARYVLETSSVHR